MIPRLLSAIQAMVEYGGASGSAAAPPVQVKGAGRITEWASQNQTALIVGAAVILLLWLLRSSRRA